MNTTIKQEGILNTPDDKQTGYYVEFTGRFPEYLHDIFAPAPETLIPQEK